MEKKKISHQSQQLQEFVMFVQQQLLMLFPEEKKFTRREDKVSFQVLDKSNPIPIPKP